MSDEVTRALDAARDAAREFGPANIPDTAVREIVRSVFLTLDEFVEEAQNRDVDWPTAGDLAVLSRQIPPVV